MPKLKPFYATQVFRDFQDIKKSPILGLTPTQIVEIIERFEVGFPLKYVEGEKCPGSFFEQITIINVEGRILDIISSETHTDSLTKNTLRVYAK